MANCVFQIVRNYNLLGDVHALVFDTTASNTGEWKGSDAMFERMLDRAVLWLACRHHIPGLHIKHANEVIRGESDAPEDKLFKQFRNNFPLLTWLITRHGIGLIMLMIGGKEQQTCCSGLIIMQDATLVHEDYRELLELVTIYLGGGIKRVQNKCRLLRWKTRRSTHGAQFMASCLYPDSI